LVERQGGLARLSPALGRPGPAPLPGVSRPTLAPAPAQHRTHARARAPTPPLTPPRPARP
jgi:hypothetical protein